MSARYQVLPPTAPVPAPDDILEAMAREGARRMLARALEIEREEFLGRVHYQRGAELRGYRNGYAPERTVGTGMGAVAIRQPRVSHVPAGAEPFASEIIGRYERRSETQARLLARLYLEGLATGDFEPVFREAGGRHRCALAEQHPAAQAGVGRRVSALALPAAQRALRVSVRRRPVSQGGARV